MNAKESVVFMFKGNLELGTLLAVLGGRERGFELGTLLAVLFWEGGGF